MIEAANSNEWIRYYALKNFKSLLKIKGSYKNLKQLAPDVFTKAYPTIPLLAHSKLVTQTL
jgi:hypothetical protein